MKSKSNPFVIASLAVFTVFTHTASAVDIIKQDNATALNLDASWTTVQPTATDVAVWDATVLAANTSALGGDLSWQGIRIASPVGLVTVTHAAGQTLTLGTSGIDMSAATQNLNLLTGGGNTAGTLVIGGAQTWNVLTGRMLTLFSTSNSANQRLSGSGNIAVSGGGTVTMNVGDLGSTTFAAGNGNDTYTGNWTISGGSKVISLRNGSHAWGTGTITLDNGIISQQQGNWSYNNNITIGAGGGTITSDSSGNARFLNLTGVISGSGALQFNSLAAMTTGEGHILTGTNTHNGTMLINANATVRIGGDATTATNSNAAGTLGAINSAVAITNNGILGFGRTDAHTFGNAISGTGVVRLGRVGGTLPANQVVTLSGVSDYTGATQVNAGRLNLTGSLTSAITVLGTNSAAISGTGLTTGLLTTSAGSSIALAGGATTTSLTSNGVTFGGATVVNFLTTPSAATTYDVVTYGAGAATNFPANLTANAHGTLSDNGGAQKIQFASDGAQTRTWDGVTGAWVNGGATDLWLEGDQDFYNLDSVIFNEPAAAAIVTLSGRLSPTAVTVNNTTNPYTFTGTAGSSDITGASSLTKNNGGTLVIDTQQTFTGNITINGGNLNAGATANSSNPTGTSLGDMTTVGKTVTVNSGGTLTFTAADGFGQYTYKTPVMLVADGGTITRVNGSFNSIGSVTLRNGGHLTSANGQNATVNSLSLNGDVTVTGTSGSFIDTSGSSNNGIHLATGVGSSTISFDVASTGDATADLTVSASLIDKTLGGAAGIIKTGAGKMVLSASNTYTGATTITGGTLAIGASNVLANTAVSIGAATLAAGTGFGDTVGTLDPTAAATINIGAGATLAFAKSDGIDWTGGTLNITGTFVPGNLGSLRFGNSGNQPGLTPGQLSQITASGFTGFGLDVDGFLTATVAAGFSSWASTNAPGQTIIQDHDNDGVSNGVEYFMGLTGTGFTSNPSPNASNVISWPKGASYTGVYGTDYAVQISSDLGVGNPWTDVPLANVTIDGDSVDYDLDTAPAGTKKFARLKVTGP